MSRTYRYLTFEDASAYFDLRRTQLTEIYGGFAMSQSEIIGEWQIPDFELEKDAYAAFSHNGHMLGYVELLAQGAMPLRPVLRLYVRPEERRQSIESHLLDWGFKRAQVVFERVPEDARVVLAIGVGDDTLRHEVEKRGFTSNQHQVQMSISLDDDIPQPTFPDSFEVVTMKTHPHLIDYVQAYRTAFRDLRNFTEDTLENRLARWQKDIDIHHEHYDPDLFTLVRDGNAAVGVLMAWLTSRHDLQAGVVSIIGVLPDYRRQGIGLNLLYRVFHQLRERGKERVSIGVDGNSLTGADKLYKKAGFRPIHTIHTYEYELRAGVELTYQG